MRAAARVGDSKAHVGRDLALDAEVLILEVRRLASDLPRNVVQTQGTAGIGRRKTRAIAGADERRLLVRRHATVPIERRLPVTELETVALALIPNWPGDTPVPLLPVPA